MSLGVPGSSSTRQPLYRRGTQRSTFSSPLDIWIAEVSWPGRRCDVPPRGFSRRFTVITGETCSSVIEGLDPVWPHGMSANRYMSCAAALFLGRDRLQDSRTMPPPFRDKGSKQAGRKPDCLQRAEERGPNWLFVWHYSSFCSPGILIALVPWCLPTYSQRSMFSKSVLGICCVAIGFSPTNPKRHEEDDFGLWFLSLVPTIQNPKLGSFDHVGCLLRRVSQQEKRGGSSQFQCKELFYRNEPERNIAFQRYLPHQRDQQYM
ncbi:hypothetical protein BJ166DRAFT_138514 [Pestalotiopsis sp. NC0098]|nr:hypothetical protein BJ166DRAFT_138514 [Pestalotiopsis sp. NC0098]